jgi:hypothetical protein
MTRPTSLGVLVPCRNEVAVVARKVANLARASWPLGAAHRLVIVDDGSDDGTAEAARAALALHAQALEAAGVSAEVVANDVRPGKPGAIAAGLARLAEVDLVVLTDADVVLEPAAPCALALAFERDARLAMACGAQRFVRDLADDGSAAAADGGEPVPAAGGFDRWTARVRRIESRAGLLFSVHGQLLAWRAELGLAPTPGIAADDLDLMLQVRARAGAGARVELVPDARFLEVKATGPAAREQALRRARAYVQVVRAWEACPPRSGQVVRAWEARPPRSGQVVRAWEARRPCGEGRLARAQWRFYRHVPLAAPALTVGFVLALLAAAAWAFGIPGALAALGAVVLAGVTVARGWLVLVLCIRAAGRAERAAPLAERWEMARR